MSIFRAGGVAAIASAVARKLGLSRIRCYPSCRLIVSDAVGLEIGGPSRIFARRGMIPLYSLAERVDNCTFARSTIWEGANSDGDSWTFHRGRSLGRQFIAEATDLGMVPSGSYDFVLSSHMLEHTANPLGALLEWRRVLKAGGGLVLVVPHRDGTFDHQRPITTLQHLIEDLEARMGEDDLTHLPEALRYHDVSMDLGVRDIIAFRERAERNAQIRSLHHHVFDTRLAADAVGKAGFDLLAVEPRRPYHLIVLARKPLEGTSANMLPQDTLRLALQRSPFLTDRQGSRTSSDSPPARATEP